MRTRAAAAALAMLVALSATVPARADDDPVDAPAADARIPPRLSYVHGDVSFWRPGAEAWAPAQVNTPLAPGDLLYVGQEGGFEIQVGSRGFVRAAAGTHLGLDNQEPDFLQFRLTGGHASLDLRSVEPGHTVELATPNAVLTLERPGYYRAIVAEETTTFIARRGGHAVVTPATGEATTLPSGSQLVVSGEDTPTVAMASAPDMDTWDQWNYERTGAVLSAQSTQYVPADVAGVDELDRHGTWRVEPAYGPVWVPSGVAAGWAPYSTGSWIWDPFYGWTWVDAAPWGWAPYHYGRWVHVRGYWAWAPGPVVVRPVYAPALVAFFGIGVRGPLGWCALGWGEPLLPWWGRPTFVGRPWWGGWGGPRVVNRVVVHKTVIVKPEHVTVFQNTRVKNAVVVVDRDRFGQGPVHRARVDDRDIRTLRPVRGDLAVQPRPASRVVAPGPATRPPERLVDRGVVATRRPPERAARVRESERPGRAETPARIVPAPPRERAVQEPSRPGSERSRVPDERQRRDAAPGRGEAREPRPAEVAPRAPALPREGEPAERRATPGRPSSPEARPQPGQGRPESPRGSGEAPRPDVRRPEPADAPRARPELRRPERPEGPGARPESRQPEPPAGSRARPESRQPVPPETPRARPESRQPEPPEGPRARPESRQPGPPETPRARPDARQPERPEAPRARPELRQPEPGEGPRTQPESRQPRPEIRRPEPPSREQGIAPGRRAPQGDGPGLRGPAPGRAAPQREGTAPGQRLRGAGDHQRGQIRARPDDGGRQPAARPQRSGRSAPDRQR
jgi:hypothetical protein